MGENETRFLSLSGQGFQLIRGTVMAEKKEFIRIRGARENNLKALNVDIPRNQFVVFTGLSGSGKSSLAFALRLPFPRVGNGGFSAAS